MNNTTGFSIKIKSAGHSLTLFLQSGIKHMFLLLLFMLFLFPSCNGPAGGSADAPTTDTINKGQLFDKDTSIVAVMMRVSTLIKTGNDAANSDRDFAQKIIYINQAALAVTTILLAKGTNLTLMQYAKEKRGKRKKIIDEMMLFLQREPDEYAAHNKEKDGSTSGILPEPLSGFDALTGSIDKQFVQAITLLQQAAVALAETETRYGSHQTLKIQARHITADEKEEMNWLQSWLQKQAG